MDVFVCAGTRGDVEPLMIVAAAYVDMVLKASRRVQVRFVTHSEHESVFQALLREYPEPVRDSVEYFAISAQPASIWGNRCEKLAPDSLKVQACWANPTVAVFPLVLPLISREICGIK